VVGSKTEQGSSSGSDIWRKIKKVIVHHGFQSEALSWKGYDLALLKLEPVKSGNSGNGGTIIPACVAATGFSDATVFKSLDVFMAGFGRRAVPHCLTDDMGPEQFGVCGRPMRCTTNHRTKQCGLDFLYEGQKHTECVKDHDTPSTRDLDCQRLRWSRRAPN
jgi:hypothetical protein